MSVPVSVSSPSQPLLFSHPHLLRGAHRISAFTRLHSASMSADDPQWPTNFRSPLITMSPTSQTSPIFPILSSNADFRDPAILSVPSPNFHVPHPPAGSSHDGSAAPVAINQAQSNIGPARIITRGRHVLEASGHSQMSDYSNHSPTHQHHPIAYMASSQSGLRSRSLTPIQVAESEKSSYPHELQTMTLPSPAGEPSTPDSSISPYSYFSRHSRSNSASNNSDQRSASPALSTATSDSSTSAPNTYAFSAFPRLITSNLSTVAHPRQKHRKQRLFNVDRKAICQYHRDNPTARQEDIALRYGVERSTISKILKHKTKWLNIPSDEEVRVAKHRPSKFPEIEEQMVQWLSQTSSNTISLTDNALRAKAKAVARDLGISEDKFKASSGWIENFKHRHGIKGGAWMGDGKNTRTARALGAGIRVDGLPASPTSPTASPLSMFSPRPDMTGDAGARSFSSSPTIPGGPEPQHVSMRTSLRLAWPEVSPDPGMAVDYGRESSPISPTLETTVHRELDRPIVPPDDAQLPTVQERPFDDRPIFADGDQLYQPVPSIPDNRPPTTAEAEDYLNKVLLFFDTTGRGILTPQERESLTVIKCVLFQAASGVPYNR